MVRASIIIPTYNDADALELCLAALRTQTLSPAEREILVVDNGSDTPPPTRDTVEGLTILTEPGPGSYRARNTGLHRAKGEVLAFTDADCIPDPSWIETALEVLDRDTEIDLIAGHVEVFARDPTDPTPVELYEVRNAFPQEVYAMEMGFSVTANLVVRRTVVDQIGPFNSDLRSGGDVDFGNRAVAAGHRISYEPSVVVRHPARRTLRSYRDKLRRTIAGAADRATAAGQPYPFTASESAHDLLPPVRSVMRAIGDATANGNSERFKLAYAVLAIHYIRAYYKFVTRFRIESPR